MENKKVKKEKKEKVIKDRSALLKKFLIVLFVLLIIEVVLIPLLYLAEVKKALPIVFFVLIPTAFGVLILLLSRSCFVDYNKKKSKVIEKLSNK